MLHGTPTAVLVYAHVLILGLDSGNFSFLYNLMIFRIELNNFFFLGNVHIYYVDDFETINFNTINSKKLSLDSTAVIALNIMVCTEEYLIVTYSKKIYTVKFVW